MFDMPYEHNGIDINAFIYPRINRLEMPGPEPELLCPGKPTPIILSVHYCMKFRKVEEALLNYQ